MKMKVKWEGNMGFTGTGDSGHPIKMDASEQIGGKDEAARPMETLLAALGGCTGMDIISILRKMRQDIEYFDMDIDAERAPEHPKVYTKIHLHYRLQGQNLEEEKVRKAVELSREKYCSVSKNLTAEITTTYEINNVVYEYK